MKVKFSNTYAAKRKRIARLPVLVNDAMQGQIKGHAEKFIKIFHDGIKKDDLGLRQLEAITIASKQKYSQPETPLYAAGDDQKNSYANMLRLRKLKNGWKVYPSKARHWKSGIPLDKMLIIHENGATIKTPNGLIVIPPRPALHNAYIQLQKSLLADKRETSITVRNAIREYIKKGSDGALKGLSK